MYDVIVLGAGPAGANAALEAADNGLKTLLLDEQKVAGGQVWRAKSKSILKAPSTEASEKGDELRTKINQSAIEVKFNSRVWHIEKQDDDTWLMASDAEQLTAKALIIATGSQERIIPTQGWTLPGVIGLGGATVLFKEHMMVPGRRTVVAGNGPLVFLVASEIIRLKGTVAAVVSLNNRIDWLKALPSMLSNPSLAWQGFKWIFKLYKMRVPVFWQHGINKIEGKEKVEGVTVIKVDHNWHKSDQAEQYIPAESVCYGHGLMPAIEATRLAGADHHYDELLGGWVPTIDKYGRTSVSNLYACGDNAGILGVSVAPMRGRMAALAVLEDLTGKKHNKKDLKIFDKAKKIGLAATALSIPRSGLQSFITKDTEVCRCECISRREIEHEIKTGALSPNAVKSGTRCGMGPCGGRYCSESLALITQHISKKTRSEIGLSTARSPLRPVALDDISNEIDYDKLPIPGVSPL
ncbi:MAG: FAD-dependent oxidoreductase [Kordiimonadaceae bacterium]|nr:FAD-dependent oxidoreductase [Kordiimonadaceae bacterium]MBT6328582.1 FAD-dependent oxidoreductase [Kordiimonadaceae bacterium]